MTPPSDSPAQRSWRLREKADVLTQMGRPAEALRAALDALALEPDSADALCLVARAQAALGRTDEALATAERACAADPDSHWSHRLRAVYHARRGEYVQAVAAAREAVRLAPDDDQALSSLVDALAGAGDLEEAMRVALHISEIAPASVWACERCGGLALERGQPAEAETHFRRGLALDPLHNVCLANLGWALDAQGRHREAIDCYAMMLAQHPADPYVERVRQQLDGSVRAYMREYSVGWAFGKVPPAEFTQLWEERQAHWNTLPAAVRQWYARHGADSANAP